jgi:hypothetical protein
VIIGIVVIVRIVMMTLAMGMIAYVGVDTGEDVVAQAHRADCADDGANLGPSFTCLTVFPHGSPILGSQRLFTA